MLKFKDNAVKTMAKALADKGRARKPEGSLEAGPSEIINLNQQLREAFGAPVSKKTPAKPITDKIQSLSKLHGIVPEEQEDDISLATATNLRVDESVEPREGTVLPAAAPLAVNAAPLAGGGAATSSQGELEEEKQRRLEEQKRDEEEKKRLQEKLRQQEEAKKAQEEKKKGEEEAKRVREAAEIARKDKELEEERQRKAQEEWEAQQAAKAAQEFERRRRERLAAQEKIRQENIRIQAEKEKARQERRRRLALLEMEREKRVREALGHEQQKAALPDMENDLAEKARIESLSLALQNLIVRLRAKKSSQEKQLLTFPGLKEPLEQKKAALKAQISRIKNTDLAAAEASEKEVEKLEMEEKAKRGRKLNVQETKALEQKLWEIEDRRKECEKKRWEAEDRINNIVLETEKLDGQIKQKDDEVQSIRQKILDLTKQEKLVKFAMEKGKLEEEMLKNINEKDGLTPPLEDANNKKNSLQASLKELSEKEAAANVELNSIEQEEKKTINPKEKRAIEQKRWQINDTLKSTIQSKWESEQNLKEINSQVQSLQSKVDAINAKIDKIQSNISNSEISLEGEGLPVRVIRDVISDMLKDNGIEVDPEILKDIVQAEDAAKKLPDGSDQPAAPTVGSQPLPKKEMPAEKPAPTEKSAQAAQPVKPAAPEMKPAAPIAPTAAPKQDLAQQDEKIKPDAKIATATEKDAMNADQEKKFASKEKQVSQPAAEKTAPAQVAATEKKSSAEENDALESVWKPETKLSDIAKKPANAEKPVESPALPPDAAADAAAVAKPEETVSISPQTASFYREQVESTVPANIRTFPFKEPSGAPADVRKTAPPAIIDLSKISPTPQKLEMAPDLETATEKPAFGNWENRWDQIKKTTTPLAGAAPATMPSAPAHEPEPVKLEPKPSGNSKLLVRILVILAVVIVIGIALAIILTKNKSSIFIKGPTDNQPAGQTDAKPPAGETPTTGDGKKETTVSLAVINTIPIYTENLASVPNLISPYLLAKMESNGYYRIVIQNKKDNTTVGLRQFFDIYKVNAPPLFFSSVSDDFTLFIYSNNGKNRIGFATLITNTNNLQAVMKDWEGSLMQDTDNLFKLLGRKTQSQTANVKFAAANTANGIQYRSMDFLPASDNFSLAYAIYNDKYLIFTTSKDSMGKIFDQLPK
jgi:hypothetical protein